MSVIDNKLRFYINNVSPVRKSAFFAAVVWGLITHLAGFSAGLMYHDSVNYSGLGSTYTSGRWMLGVLNDIGARLSGVYQLPYINGFLVVLTVAIVCALTVKLLKVETILTGALVGAMLVSFPSVASLFSVTFTAPAYTLSLLLSVLSVCAVNEKRTVPRFAAAVGLLCLSIGIYQAYITFAASLALIIVICDGVRQNDGNVKPLILKGLCFAAVLAAGLGLYLAVNRLFLSAMGLTMTSYQNLDKMGQFSLGDMKNALIYAYSDQIKATWAGIISSAFMTRLTRCINLLSLVLFVWAIWSKRKNTAVCAVITLAFLLLPAALNSVYIICPGNRGGVHALMRHSLAFTYIFPLVLLELLSGGERKKIPAGIPVNVALALLLIVPLFYTYRDNTAYLHAKTAHEEAILYYNSLITRIRDTQDYSDDLPVAYIGAGIEDETFAALPTQDRIYTYGLHYSEQELVNNHQWRDFCALHLGWSPKTIDNVDELKCSEAVRSMPAYPADGSIKVIDGTVVVKLSETE